MCIHRALACAPAVRVRGSIGPSRTLTAQAKRTQSSSSSPGLEGTAYCRLLNGTVLPETQDGPSSNSSMTTRELQEHWQKEKSRWRHVKLLFEIASARIEERRVSKFVVSRA